jgi:hypothetical protein
MKKSEFKLSENLDLHIQAFKSEMETELNPLESIDLDVSTDKMAIPRFFGFGKDDVEPFENEALPITLTNRTFIQNLAALSYEINQLPGHIVKFDEAKKDYKIVSIKRFVQNNFQPEIVAIDDGVLYDSKINAAAEFNGSFLIGGLKVGEKTIMELVIQDVFRSIVPGNKINLEALKEVADDIPAAELKHYSFIKGTTLTLINNKKYREQKFEAKVNATYVTAGGKVFSSNQKFARERLVAMDLIALNELL